MNAEVAIIKTAAETALAQAFAQARRGCPATTRSRRSAPPRSICSPRKVCRTAASRSGSTPICAR